MKRKFASRQGHGRKDKKHEIEAIEDFENEDHQDIDRYLQEHDDSDLDQDFPDLYQNSSCSSSFIDPELLAQDSQSSEDEDVGKREFVAASSRHQAAPSNSEEEEEEENQSESLCLDSNVISRLAEKISPKEPSSGRAFPWRSFTKAIELLESYIDDDDDDQSPREDSISEEETSLQQLIILLFQTAPLNVAKHLKMPEENGWWEQKMMIPTSSPIWKSYCCKPFKRLFEVLLKLLTNLTSSASLLFVLSSIQPSLVFLRAFPRAFSNFTEQLLQIWSRIEARSSTADEKVKVAALLILRKISLCSKVHLERLLRGMYQKFAASSKSITVHNISTVNFLLNSMLEIYRLDPSFSYHYAFMFIRQLALAVRSLISPTNSRELADPSARIKRVFSWQFLYCLKFWCKFLGQALGTSSNSIEDSSLLLSGNSKKSSLQSLRLLVYPVVQISQAVLNLSLKTKQQYFPFFLAVIRQLNELSIALGDTFIPTVPYILTIIEVMNGGNHSLAKGDSLKPFDLSSVYKVSKAWVNTRIYFDLLLEECSAALLESFGGRLVAGSAAGFPAYSEFVISRLKKCIKEAKNPKVSHHLNEIVAVLRENAAFLAEGKSSCDAPLIAFWASFKKTMDLKKKMAAEDQQII